jgi:hypothetical protein
LLDFQCKGGEDILVLSFPFGVNVTE